MDNEQIASVFGQQRQKPKNGPENDYSQALGLLGKGSGGGKDSQGAGSLMNGNSYDMGQALSSLWKSQGTPTQMPQDSSMSEGGGGGGGMDMNSMASIAMMFI